MMSVTQGIAAAACVLGLASVVAAQDPALPVLEVAKVDRPLSAVELIRVMDAMRTASAGKTFRLIGLENRNGPESQLVIDQKGRPLYVHQGMAEVGDLITWYTGVPAASCNARPLGQELVVDYFRSTGSTSWKVTARTGGTYDTASLLQMLMATADLEGGPLARVGNRWARQILASWVPPKGMFIPDQPADPKVRQALLIDVETLLPMKWEIVHVTGMSTEWGWSFTHDSSLSLRPPADITTPTCVE